MIDGFWLKFWMESGRGHSVINETYKYFKYTDGYSEKDDFEDVAYRWAGHDMGGFDLMRFKSGFEVVKKPPEEWLEKELERLKEEREMIIQQENLIKSELVRDGQI